MNKPLKQSPPNLMKHPKVFHTKLGRHKADGLQRPGEIFIDPRLPPKRKLVVMVHELLHDMHPTWPEERVEREGEHIGTFLWKHGYRKVEQ